MTVSGKDKRGLIEELRTLRTRLDRLERRNAELVQAEKELRQSLEQFRTVFEDSLVGLYRTTPDGQVLMANPTLVNMLGYSSFDELARRNLENEGYEPQYPRAAFKDRIEREGKVIGLESAWKRPDGTTLYVRESAQAVCDELGNTLYYQGTVEDITQRKQAEEALRKAHEELEMRVQERTAELQQVNDALRQSESRYRTVIENAGEGIVVAQDGVLRFVNPQHISVTGRSQEESTSRPFIEFVHPDDRQRVTEIHAARLRGEEVPSVYELRVIDKEGQTKWLENNGVLIDWDGKPASLNFLRDITDRKKAQEALRQSESRYRTVIEHAGEAIVVIEDSMFRFANPRAREIMGYSEEEMMSRLFIAFIHPDDCQRVAEIHAARLRGEQVPPVYELRVIDKEGRTKWLENNGVLIEWTGRPASLNFLRDITARKNAEEALREREETIRALVETSRDWIWSIDLNGVHTYCNAAVEQILGYGPDELVGRLSLDLIHEDDRRVIEANLPTWIAEKRGWSNLLIRWRHRDGTYRYLESNAVPILTSENRLVGFRGVDRDITERRQAEKTLRETTGLLETIFSHTHILVACLDRQFNFVRVNRAYAEADGREPSLFVGRNHFELYPNAENEAIFHKVVEIGIPYFAQAKPFEYAEHPERGITYWDWSLVPIKQQDGVVCGLVLTLANVTEQKRAEEALRKSEERFRQFFENEPEYCYMVSPEGTILDVNAAALKALGYRKEELLGEPCGLIYAPESLPKATALFEKWKSGEAVENEELIIRAKDGTQHTVLLSSSFVRDSGGQVLHSVSVQRDITDLKEAEQALREREAALTSVFRAAPVGIGLERDRVLARLNDTVCRMLGYSREELIGQHARMFYPGEEDYQRVRGEKHQQILETGTATVETRWKRKDGRIIDVLLSTVVLDPADFSKGVTFTVLDITERKAAEETLRESEEKFRSLADQSPNMIFINKKGRVIYANKKCEETMGYTREELCAPDFDYRTLIAPESADVIKESFARHSRGEEVEPYDYCLISKAGQRIEAINASKLIQYEGQSAILGVVTDITERKRAEQALRESQERLKILFESAPDAIYVTDLDGRFVDGNRAAEELVGFTKDELIGKSLAESGLLCAEGLSKAAANLLNVAAGRPSGPTEYTVRKKSGSLIAVEVRTFPVSIGGRILSLGIARDITARRHTEEAIKASEKKFRSIFETAANLIASLDEQGIVVDCNDRVQEFLGYDKEEIVGRSMARIIHSDYLGKAQDALKEILAKGFSHDQEYKMVRKDGSLVDVSINASAIEDEYGKYTRALCIIDDITERKRARQRLLDDREQLKSLASQLSLTEERERHRLATVLHDQVGQSLVFSKIKLDQLCKSESAGELAEALKNVSRCLERVIQDTRRLTFDLSYPLLYELGFEPAVAEWLTEEIQEKHGIETEFQDDGQAKPLNDDIRALLFRNVRELLINIVKHARAKHVKISIEKADKYIRVSVEDDGVGFDPVEVAAMAAKRAEFGLFSVRERLAQLGGRIAIESKPGQGTTITMTAPLKDEQANDGV